jgi:hypothetical protein
MLTKDPEVKGDVEVKINLNIEVRQRLTTSIESIYD